MLPAMPPPTTIASNSSKHPLLTAAQELAPRIAARSNEIEAARRLPADLAQEMAKAGLFRMWTPEAYGGFEVHPTVLLEVLMIGSEIGVTAAWLPEQTARAVFGPQDAIVGGVNAPFGVAERVEGGFRVTGRWPWASGSQNCQWLMVGAMVTQQGRPNLSPAGMPELRFLVVPARDVVLHDTWYASGMCGTGSCDMELKDLFVPDEHTFGFINEAPRISRPLFACPPFGLLSMGVAAVTLGIARRAIDELSALARQKILMPSRQPLASRAAVQSAVAEAEAQVRSARALLFEAVNSTFTAATRGEVSTRNRAELRLAITHAVRASVRAVDLMYEAAGGTAVFRTSPLQRCFRDVHTVTQHAMVAAPTLETIGSVLLGLETDTTLL
jgi:alkylation response protein AidB-like acyl-CoA dehydrogenase